LNIFQENNDSIRAGEKIFNTHLSLVAAPEKILNEMEALIQL